MNRQKLALISIAVMLAMIGLAASVAKTINGEMPLPTHWNIHGQADQFSDKWTALLMPVLVAGGTSLLFYVLPAIESRSEGLRRSQGLYQSAWAAMLLMSILIQLAVVSVAFRWSIHGTSFVLAAIGLVFVLIGNQLGKSRSMYLIGIRTPWTLASEEVWIKTHRLGGKLFVGGGLLLLAAAFLPLPSGVIGSLIGFVVAMLVMIPIVYSLVLWQRERGATRPTA
jgi:uncharacterized membrane protein